LEPFFAPGILNGEYLAIQLSKAKAFLQLRMDSPKFAYVIWEGGKKNVIRCSNITRGVAASGQSVMAKLKKKSQKAWAAKVIEVGKRNLEFC